MMTNYAGEVDGALRRLDGRAPDGELQRQFERYKAMIDDAAFPCLGAKAALHSRNYRLATYGSLAAPDTTLALVRDLLAFVRDPSLAGDFTTFAAIFAKAEYDEVTFERLLWKQLTDVAMIDRRIGDWDPAVSDDPENPTFSFSFGGVALFVVGMHKNASRIARRYERPMLVFNPHRQFDTLKQRGKWERFTAAIRRRDVALQGSANPNLQDHGVASEARQYSGRAVETGWTCPFHR